MLQVFAFALISIFVLVVSSKSVAHIEHLSLSRRSSLYEFFNLSNKHWKIGMSKAYLRCRNTVVLDVRRYMLVVWKRRSQSSVIGVWEVVIPIESFSSLVNFVSI